MLRNEATKESLIVVKGNTHISIENCLFEENFAIFVSSILFAGKSNTYTSIRNCTFIRNYAVTGGVFYAESES